jgi:hypothetical protein
MAALAAISSMLLVCCLVGLSYSWLGEYQSNIRAVIFGLVFALVQLLTMSGMIFWMVVIFGFK